MPRACVIVLDAVGAGALPDASEFGDEGSDTLGNVARAVGGLDLPTLEALGLGNIEPLEGCAPQPGAPAIAGRLIERSRGKDTTTGHWELMGIVTPTAMPTYPYGFPDDVIDPFMNRTGRGVLGNVPASGTEIIQELGEEHQKTGKWIVYTSADSVFQIAAHEETIPLEELYDACRVAREILTGKHARCGRVIARPFTGTPGNYVRTANRHDFSLEPRRPNYLSLIRDAGHKVYGVGKIGDIFAHQDIDEERSPRSPNVEGIQMTEELLRHVDSGLILYEPRRDRLCSGAATTRGQLPHCCSAGFRPAPARSARCAAARRSADPDIRPRLRSNDAVDRSLSRVRAAAGVCRGAKRRWPDSGGRRVRRRRCHDQRLARRQVGRSRARDVVPDVVTIRPAELIQRKRDGHRSSARRSWSSSSSAMPEATCPTTRWQRSAWLSTSRGCRRLRRSRSPTP